MKIKATTALMLVAGTVVGTHYVDLLTLSHPATGQHSMAAEAQKSQSSSSSERQKYFCPMHPAVITDRPGSCPVCHMDLQPIDPLRRETEHKILFYRHPMGRDQTSPTPAKDEMGMDYIPVYSDDSANDEESVAVAGRIPFDLPQDAQQRIGVTTAPVIVKDLEYDIRASGRVVFDPELYTAVRDFEVTLKLGRNENDARSPGLAASSVTKLRLLGLSDHQIADIRSGKVAAADYLLPKGRVWIYADVYESEVAAVKIGQPAEIMSPGHSDRGFDGQITGINPVLDPATRTLKVRVEVQDPDGVLTPEAFVTVTIHVALGRSLAVREDAIIHTGSSDLAFVVEQAERFVPREVTLGMKAGGYYQVRSGLSEGEQVVTAANFLIDSESRIKAVVRRAPAEGQPN